MVGNLVEASVNSKIYFTKLRINDSIRVNKYERDIKWQYLRGKHLNLVEI